MPHDAGEFILKRFTPSAARALGEAIAEAGGNEVFFAGTPRSDGLVDAVRVCARGHATAVPALFESLALRDVVIHNHPSGVLTPSEADLSLASMYSSHGHGVYIVDNEATRVYVVVEPFLPSQAARLDADELARALSPGGGLARSLPRFEARPAQREMMAAVVDAFNESAIRVVEAPTGVGKTLAYLLPAAQWAVKNKERVVVSTRTINLQEQIVQKDVPVLRRALGMEIGCCLVKGRGNYLCPRKLERALSEATLFDEEREKAQLDAIAAWAEDTEDGSLAELPFVPARELWERVCSEADTCSVGRCPDARRCHVGRARRAVAKADIVVVNHHMLFSDIAIKRELGDFSSLAVLPAYKRVIFDEAHSIEDSATEYFGATVTRGAAMALLGRILRVERGRERGLAPTIKQGLVKDCPKMTVAEYDAFQGLIDGHVLPAVAAARESLRFAFDAVRQTAAEACGQIGRDIKWRLTPEALALPALRAAHRDAVLPAVAALRDLIHHGMRLQKRLRDLPPQKDGEAPPLQGEAQELSAYLARLERMANTLATVTSEEPMENTVRWIEVDAENAEFLRVARCPLHVGAPMAEWVYGNLETVVMTSATLSVGHRFDYLYERLGLDQAAEGRTAALELASPFDFREQALLGIATDLPDPGAPGFQDASVDAIRLALKASRGHAFILFTSFFALDYAHRRLAPELKAAGIVALRQGEASRSALLERFREDASSVLFATDSFWEGVDVAGEALQCVILPKLPFRVPTEPILEARSEAIEAAGGNPFMAYALPQAVIKFRQGFGRLIRSRADRGVVLVLDKRIVTKHYGRVFLRSLPPMRVLRGPADAVVEELDAFLNHGAAAAAGPDTGGDGARA